MAHLCYGHPHECGQLVQVWVGNYQHNVWCTKDCGHTYWERTEEERRHEGVLRWAR